MTQHTWAETLHTLWRTVGDETAGVNPEGTIRPSLSTDGEQALLARVSDLVERRAEAVEAFGDTLGEGGMAVVREATQASLQRRVAVKSPRGLKPGAVHRLVQEAWLTGMLQHPGIVPVHDIVVDDDGRPHILMKRIEGRTWGELDAQRISDEYGAADPVEWHLRTFLAVCNAVHYAHDRGVLHRDLKPENVMVGRFGEVYVVDWGIAVGLDDRYGGRVPLAREERRLAGSPRYLAPEMVRCDGALLSVQTDVYLLGGTLYAVLTGRPPHRGDSLREILEGIPAFRPHAPELPEPLVRILERALALDPADRFATVDELRLEVQRYLERRGALELARHAAERLEALRRHLADGATREEVYAAYAAARFGFNEALRTWPDHRRSRDGLRETHLTLARYEVQAGEPGAARIALAEVVEPPPELVEQVRALESNRARAEAELQAFRRDADPRLGVRTRFFVAGLTVVVWLVMPVVGEVVATPTWGVSILFSLLTFALLAALAVWARDSLSKTAVNRHTTWAILVVPLSNVLIDVGGMVLGLPVEEGRVLRLAGWSIVGMMYVGLVAWGLWPATLAWMALTVAAAVWPEHFVWWVALGNLILGWNVVRLWRQREGWAPGDQAASTDET